jgi:drug/metabolite transporter (DMT)-like permease
MSRARRQADWLVFAALGLMWGSSYLFIKFGLESVTPLTLVAVRLGIGALFLGLVVLVVRERMPRRPMTYLHLTVMAVLNIVVPFTLVTWAELSIDTSLAAILTAATPLFAIVIAAIALRSEPITPQRVAGLVLGFVGVVVLTGPVTLWAGGSGFAVAALLAASASYAAAAVYARRTLTGLRPTVPAMLQVTIAFAISASLALWLEQPLALEYGASALFALLWLGVLGSGIAYLAYFRLIASWGATRTTAVAYVLPVIGIVLGVLFANETVDLRVVAGTILIIGGVVLVNGRIRRRWLSGRSRGGGAEATPLRADGTSVAAEAAS